MDEHIDTERPEPTAPDLAGFIRAHRELILERWEAAVRTHPAAQQLSRPALRDSFPELIDQLAGALEEAGRGATIRTLGAIPDKHALERLDEGYGLKEVVIEYALLRATIERLWEQADPGRVNRREIRALDRAIDEAVAASVDRYTRARERTLVALDRLSTAALSEGGTMEGFLPRLLQVLMETTEAVDTVVILLRHGDELRVRASVGVDPEEGEGFSLPMGKGFSGEIAVGRRAIELRGEEIRARVLNPMLRDQGLRALYGAPLLKGDQVIGVAHIGSRSAYHFSEDDKILFRTMANRATSFIVQVETQALLDTLLTASPIGVSFLDDQLRYVRVNDALAALNRRPAEEHIGRTVRQVLPRIADRFEPMLRRILETGAPLVNFDFSAAAPEPSGPSRHFLANYYPVRGASGEVMGVGEVVLDITDRKTAELRLRETESRYRALVDSGIIGVVEWRADGAITEANDAFLRLVGYSRAELEQGKLRFRDLTPPEYQAVTDENLDRLRQTGVLPPTEKQYQRRDGSRVHVMITGAALDERGERGLALVADITERKRAEEELRRAARFRDEFIGILGHDLRNPLAAIMASAHLLLRQGSLTEAQGRAIARISNSADRIDRMISDVLDYARGRLGGGLPVKLREVDLHEVCRHVIDELQIAHPDRRIELVRRGDVHGRWDPDRLSQLVSNLVGNALSYGRRDTPIQVHLDGHSPGQVTLGVHNQGKTIPAEMLPVLFEPFTRGEDGYGETKSVGLGLYIVKQIVDAHGGEVTVRSDEASGTRFSVTLPRDVELQ